MTEEFTEEVRESLLEYINEYIRYGYEDVSDVTIKHIDEEKVVLVDKRINQSIRISWTNLLKTSLREWYDKNRDSLNIEFWNDVFKSAVDYSLDNERLLSQPGLLIQKGYAEFHIEYYTLSYNYELHSFKIGDVDCKISAPSHMYILLHKAMEDGNTINSDSWLSICTLRFEAITRENYKGYLEQALFFIYYSNPPLSDGDYPRLVLYGEIDSPLTIRSTDFVRTDFPNANYVEALNFFNTGGSTGEVLYFYKVIEYFFLINRKQEISSIIASHHNIDLKISELTKVYKEDEENLLISIMHTLKSHHKFDSVFNYAVNKNLVNSNDINEFAHKMYLYRNSIVHGKKDNRFDILTRDLINQEPDEWFNVIREVALICIEVFCYHDNLKEMVRSEDGEK